MGAALMKNIDNAKSIMKALVDEFGHKLSVSCKIRTLETFEETLEFAEELTRYSGVHFLSIHPRTQKQKS